MSQDGDLLAPGAISSPDSDAFLQPPSKACCLFPTSFLYAHQLFFTFMSITFSRGDVCNMHKSDKCALRKSQGADATAKFRNWVRGSSFGFCRMECYDVTHVSLDECSVGIDRAWESGPGRAVRVSLLQAAGFLEFPKTTIDQLRIFQPRLPSASRKEASYKNSPLKHSPLFDTKRNTVLKDLSG